MNCIKICEILYDERTFKFLESYLKNKNLNEICFIFFYDGKHDYSIIYDFIKKVENIFKININYFDISDLLIVLKEKQEKLKLEFDPIDWNQIIIDIKNAYINSIKRKMKENEDCFSGKLSM